jgi:predicted N-acetyltransferase YhbS
MPTLSRTGVEVRDAGRFDLPAVRRVLLGAYQEYAEALPPAVFGRYLTDILDVQGRTGAGRLLVATDGGRVVGTVTFYADAGQEGFGWPAGWAGLRALGVEPAARGQGIGQALVRACLERARAGGAPVLCLHTAEFMTAAVAMYERLGFRRAPAFDFEATRHLGLGGVRPVPILAYRLDLPRPRQPTIDVGAVREPGHRGTWDGPGRAPGGQRAPAGGRPVPASRRGGRRRARPPRHHRDLHGGPGPAGRAPRRPRAPGRPRPLHAAQLAREFGDTIRFTSPPRVVQGALSGLLAPVARLAGFRALDPDHVNRQLPIVDLEPLPAELADRVTGLAGQHTRSA